MTMDHQVRQPRQKRFHRKTRRGCWTCRRRRVKCDEEKPLCAKCTRGGHSCEGYEPENISKLRRSDRNYYNPAIRAFLYQPAIYRNHEDAESLASFLRKTSPMLSLFSGGSDLWTVIVPQASWQYPEVRDMLHSMSMFDRYMRTTSSSSLQVEDEYETSIWYYNKAMKSLTEKNVCLGNILLCALLAWLIESVACNFDVAEMHINHARNILRDHRERDMRIYDPSFQVVVDAVDASEYELHYQELKSWEAKGSKHSQPHPSIRSLADAQDSLESILHIHATSNLDRELVISTEHKVQAWRSAYDEYKYRPGTERLPTKRHIMLLHNIMLVLIDLQKQQLAGLTNVKQWRCVLNDADDILSIVDVDEVEQIDQGLDMVLACIIDQAPPTSEHHTKASRLRANLANLSDIQSSEDTSAT